MLQEATKILNSAFHNSFIKRLSLYLHDCVREEVQSSTFRNLKQDKDNKWIFVNENETLFTNYPQVLKLHGDDSHVTELMIQAEMSQKDRYLIYGYLFLVGKNRKNHKNNEFLTPLLYAPCKLERETRYINCILQDENLSLNTGALTALMAKNDDEDETELLLDGILEAVPDLPLTQEKLDIFITTLKSIIPDIEIALNHEEDTDEINLEKDENESDKNVIKNYLEEIEFADDIRMAEKPKIKIDKVSVTNQCAIILTKRPQITAGVLHELTQISEKPSGVFRETALSVINDEYIISKSQKSEKPLKKEKITDFFPITPLALSNSQEDVLRKIENNSLLAVYGPPGTGKSQTIVNLVAHLVANGKTVLVASRMDKAIDVVADRLNELGAPFLALRAGRMNYQKQLSFQLQDLVSNKVDLDSDYENSLFATSEDMKTLLDTIKDCENKCEQIIKLEKDWQEICAERDRQERNLGEIKYIQKKLKRDEITDISNVISAIERYINTSGFLASITNKLNSYNLRKRLGLDSFEVTAENLIRLKDELKVSELTAQAYSAELTIHKLGNLHQLLEQIKMFRNKQSNLAVEILKNKRRESLKGLLRDQIKRQRLIVHTKALTERKKNLQNRLLEEEDFRPLLDAFPCWGVTTYAISGSLPLKPGLFDVAIIDEASQCDIASCFPILYRAKKAVIVGDDKQLPHLSFLEKAKEQSFLSQYEIPDKYQLMWRFRTNSMFDLANYYSLSPVLLDEHFRSALPIINFSNNEFYGSRIRIMNKEINFPDVFELNIVNDGKVDSDVTRNIPEVEAVIKRVHEIVLEDSKNPDEFHKPVSIGIISPFRGQVEYLKKAIMQVLSDETIKRHSIEVGTAHTFQGDERDIIVLSWAVADNSFTQSLTFLQKPNLFNVAITRARKKSINFLSKNPNNLPEGLLRNYVSYIQTYLERQNLKAMNEQEGIDDNIYKNEFEKTVANALRKEGYTVKAGVQLAGLSADLYVTRKGQKPVLVECDGLEDEPKVNYSQISKQTILTRCGFDIMRISYREWFYSESACIGRVSQHFNLD